jgi:hypothetical protein
VHDYLVALYIALGFVVIVVAVGMTFRLGRVRTVTAAICAGALAALAAADAIVAEAGRYWDNHSMLGAAVSGVLFLALTVLLVEALVEYVDARRLRPAGCMAVKSFLDLAAERRGPVGGLRYSLSHSFATDSPPLLDDPKQPLHPLHVVEHLRDRASTAAEQLRRALFAAAPVLTATDELTPLFDHASRVVEVVDEIHANIAAYGTLLVELWDDRPGEQATVTEWKGFWEVHGAPALWQRVRDGWTQLAASLNELDSNAARLLATGEHEEAIWRRPPGYN